MEIGDGEPTPPAVGAQPDTSASLGIDGSGCGSDRRTRPPKSLAAIAVGETAAA